MTAKHKTTKAQVSRRTLLQTATGAALAAAVFPLAATDVRADKKKKAAVTDPDAFPPMALWLALTTNEAFNNLTAAQIAQAAGITNVTKVQTYLALVSDQTAWKTPPINNNADMFIKLRAQFQTLAGDIGYSGGQCPKGLDSIAAVAALAHS
jgi:hypothetical protein